MESKKNIAIACATVAVVVLLLSAFSGNDAVYQGNVQAGTVVPQSIVAECNGENESREDIAAAIEESEGQMVAATGLAPAAVSMGLTAGSPALTTGETETDRGVLSGENIEDPEADTLSDEATGDAEAAVLSAENTGDAEVAVLSAENAGDAETLTDENGLDIFADETGTDVDSLADGSEALSSPEDGQLLLADAELCKQYAEGLFVVTVTDKTALNVRENPTTDSRWIGKMYEGCGGKVLEEKDGWTRIKSGKVIGWVSDRYILKGEAAAAKLMADFELVFEVSSDALKVRTEPTTSQDNKIRAIYGGETYEAILVQDDWIQIEYAAEKYGWVALEYGTIRYDYDAAMTREEYEEARVKKNHVTISKTTRGETSASTDDETLLACLIQCESGNYEGMLAVANVIINRMNSRKYPNSISGVIYAAGQFSPVSSGKLETRLSKGPSSTARQAAADALAGTNNIGSFLHFRSSKSADLTRYSSYTIVAGNVFY